MAYPQVYIHPDAKIAEGVKIDPFAVIHEDVVIGENTWIANNVTIYPGTRIGKNCKIFPGAVLGAIPQDLKFAGEVTTAEIGHNTIIREFVTVNRGTKALGKTTVGSDTLLMAYVHVAHDCMVGNHCILANGVTLAGHIVVEDYAIIGGLTAIHQFVRIGSHTILAGGSLVGKDVPPYVKAAWFPLAYAGINSVGLHRRGFSPEAISDIQEIYRIIYIKGNNSTQALQVIEAEVKPSPERDTILTFIRNSSRGIMKGRGREE